MTVARTAVATPNARRYVKQLCKHFGHKVEVDYDAETGSRGLVRLAGGEARMSADDAALSLAAHGPDEETARRVAQVVEDHLLRFAFREELGPCGWEVTPD